MFEVLRISDFPGKKSISFGFPVTFLFYQWLLPGRKKPGVMQQSNRRQFLRSSAGLVALGSLPFLRLAAKPGPLAGKIRIAVKYHMIDEPSLNIVEKFRLLKEIGFDGVEVKTDHAADTSEFVTAIGETGLPVHGVIHSSKPNIAGAVNFANQLGGDSVLVLASEDPKISYDENFRLWQGRVHEAVAIAEKSGISCAGTDATPHLPDEPMLRYVSGIGFGSLRRRVYSSNSVWSPL